VSSIDLPRGAGTVIFPGGGAWLPRGRPGSAPAAPPSRESALLLSDPARILIASQPQEIPALLAEVEAEQARGHYVAGYLAYEAGAAFGLTVRNDSVRPLPAGALACDSVPLAWLAVYPPGSATLLGAGEWAALLDSFDEEPVAARLAALEPELNVDREEYTSAIAWVRDYIAAGDTYQVNYTVRARYDLSASTGCEAPSAGRRRPGGSVAELAPGAARGAGAAGSAAAPPLDPLDYFLALVVRQAVPYAAYLDLGDTQVLSLSPELFLRRDGDVLESRPMKGTRPRGVTHPLDVALAYELAETEKERAENLMIVDMVRNDLGRVSRTGSIHVPALFAVEPYRTVWQMTSTVQGQLQPGTSLGQIMRAVFPGASITGAPKHHTMEIIAEVESEPRGVYTGTVALFAPGGDFTANIGIRTIVHRAGSCVLGIGSGIVWDAQAPAEYEETLAKGAFAVAPAGGDWRPSRTGDVAAGSAAPAYEPPCGQTGPPAAGEDGLHLFETLLLEAGGHYRYLDGHLARMAASASALGFRFDREGAGAALQGLAEAEKRPLVVRMDLDREGIIELSTREAPPAPAAPVSLLVSPFRVDPDDPLLVHKTTRRGFYDREHRRAVAERCFDALFLNRLDQVTEGGITNIFARFGSTWITPPLADGLLAGVWRRAFMAEKGALERSLTLEQLLSADEILAGNSVRGAVPVVAILADPLVY
jgi:para-aminobenzoate synthetase / 4-amino-4-deoxychorismate lyase